MESRPHELSRLSDTELLRSTAEVVQRSQLSEADLVAYLAEVDARRLFAREARPSMFTYCTRVLHFSEPETYLRITVARASRAHPVLLSMLADGRLHLSAIERLAPHLTPENRETVLARAVHKTKREVEELVAELAPRPDAPTLVRKLPVRRVLSGSELRVSGVAATAGSASSTTTGSRSPAVERTAARRSRFCARHTTR